MNTDPSMKATVTPIGYVRTSRSDLDGIAPQATAAPDDVATVVIDDDLVDGLLGLERYRYLWLVTWLHHRESADRPPLQLVSRATEARGEVQGVFASRAPQRPNPIGLSLVRHLGTEGTVISVAGIDLLDGTPVLDIKPWFADCDDPAAFSPTV